ncbi:M48 family metalloprotease [Streptomyces sp. NPDC057638]|uniref:M48 family metalloprotease n=1 Tax=Streptomyces sp. NPDC057638 TaxID=3346190 RepID=UPI0036A347B8
MRALLSGLRGVLAVGLLTGFYVVVCALLLLDAGLVAMTLWGILVAPARFGNGAMVVAGGIPVGFALGYGLVTVSGATEAPPGAVPVRREAAPGLWRLVEELAERQGTRPPGRILLTPEANASVSEEAWLLGLLTGERTMYLGVPLLTRLRPVELRAVLAHELGHYAGRHTRFGAVSYRGAESLRSTLLRLRLTEVTEPGKPGLLSYAYLFRWAIAGYAWLYLRLSLAVRRRQELEADAAAVAVAGPAATAEALRAVHALGFAWSGFHDRYLRPVQGLGFVPEDVFETFAAMLDDPEVRERLAERRAHPAETGGSALDSHPPLVRRLALIEARAAEEPPAPLAEPLLADPRAVARVERGLLAQTRGTPTALPHAQWADLAAEAFAIELASLLLDAARGVGAAARPTLGTVLDLLEAGEREELARRLTDAPSPGEQLAEALYALTGQALAGAGRAHWALSWTEGYRLVRHGGPAGDLEELVTAAAHGTPGVAALRRELARLGVAVEAPVPLALRTVLSPAGRTRVPRSARRVPASVARERLRQRNVRRLTIGAVIVVSVVWGVSMIRTGGSTRIGPAYEAGSSSVRPMPSLDTVWPRPTGDALPGGALPGVIPTPGATRYSPSWGSGLWDEVLKDIRQRSSHVVTVRRGETLSGLACRYRTTVAELRKLNRMDARDVLRAGQTLRVPSDGLRVIPLRCR